MLDLQFVAASTTWSSSAQPGSRGPLRLILLRLLFRLSLQVNGVVLHQISASYLQVLHSVLNLAAWLIMQKQKYDCITATLCDDIHWLPLNNVQAMYHCLQLPTWGRLAAPPYLADIHTRIAASIGHHNLCLASHGIQCLGQEDLHIIWTICSFLSGLDLPFGTNCRWLCVWPTEHYLALLWLFRL